MSTGLDFLISVNEGQADALVRVALSMHEEANIFRAVAWALRSFRTNDAMNRDSFAANFYIYYNPMSDAHKAVVRDKLSKDGYALPHNPNGESAWTNTGTPPAAPGV